MDAQTLTGAITAATGLITAIGGVILALKVWIPTHTAVNQQRTDLTNFQTVLINTLKAHDIEIPEDQSKVQPR